MSRPQRSIKQPTHLKDYVVGGITKSHKTDRKNKPAMKTIQINEIKNNNETLETKKFCIFSRNKCIKYDIEIPTTCGRDEFYRFIKEKEGVKTSSFSLGVKYHSMLCGKVFPSLKNLTSINFETVNELNPINNTIIVL